MEIAYVKMDKPKENKLWAKIKYKLRYNLGMVYKDRYTNNYYINKVNKRQISKLKMLMLKYNIDYAISEARNRYRLCKVER